MPFVASCYVPCLRTAAPVFARAAFMFARAAVPRLSVSVRALPPPLAFLCFLSQTPCLLSVCLLFVLR